MTRWKGQLSVARSLLIASLLCVGMVGCAGWEHGSVSGVKDKMLGVWTADGAERLRIERNFDGNVDSTVKVIGEPDYLLVRSISEVRLFYVKLNRVYVFERSVLSTDGNISIVDGIPNIYVQQFRSEDQQRLSKLTSPDEPPQTTFATQPIQRGAIAIPPAPEEPVLARREYWALLIGISNYQYVDDLETPIRDITAIRDVLIERYRFRRDRISLLLDQEATREGIENALYSLSQHAGPEDSVFIYYAGHGQADGENQRGFWVPFDGKARSTGTFISNSRIRDDIDIAAMRAKHVYLVADSCFSGSLFARSRSLPPLNDKFFSRLDENKSRWAMTSGMNEPVADGGKGGHSIFAYFFLKLLKENQDPYLVPSHIYDRLAALVANNSNQQPRSQPLQSAGDEGGQFVFRLSR